MRRAACFYWSALIQEPIEILSTRLDSTRLDWAVPEIELLRRVDRRTASANKEQRHVSVSVEVTLAPYQRQQQQQLILTLVSECAVQCSAAYVFVVETFKIIQ